FIADYFHRCLDAHPPIIFFLFFFLPHPPHRLLPSSPTRRSSDLFPADGNQRLKSLLNARVRASGPVVEKHDPMELKMPVGDKNQDRKSTRLNSSHVAISYAVFCLKKKKKILKTLPYTTCSSTL